MVSFKNQCIALRRRGLSLNRISIETKRPKTSVYFHIRNIPLCNRRKREIHFAAIKRFTDYSKSIKGKSRLNRHPTHFHVWNTTSVSLIGHLIFDGEIKHSGCVYTNRNSSLIHHVNECMQTIYPFPPKKYESLPGVYKIAYHNVELGSFLKSKAVELIAVLRNAKIELKHAFLCSFFNDEGSVYFRGNRRAVRGYQHNIKILRLIKTLLKDFGIESKIEERFNEITITKKENIKKFAKEINFFEGVCVNGNRSNSVWKQSFEKRKILRDAILSYQK